VRSGPTRSGTPNAENGVLVLGAIVVLDDGYEPLQIESVRKRRSQGLTVEMFETVEEAMAWLKSR
jgi:hypothetical protein